MKVSESSSTERLAVRLVSQLRDHGWRLGVAESLTGGLVVAAIVDVPGASAVLQGGVVAYATEMKQSLLGVDPELLAHRGAVDPEVARQMARGVRRATSADGHEPELGIATTGVAGPDPADGQPVGTVYIGLSSPRTGDHASRLDLAGSRGEIRREATRQALLVALSSLSGELGNSRRP